MCSSIFIFKLSFLIYFYCRKLHLGILIKLFISSDESNSEDSDDDPNEGDDDSILMDDDDEEKVIL